MPTDLSGQENSAHWKRCWRADDFLFEIAGVMRPDGINLISDLVSVTLDALEDEKKIAIFTEPGKPLPESLSLAEKTGVQIYELDPVTCGELEKDAYINAMRKNAGEIVRAFGTGDVD